MPEQAQLNHRQHDGGCSRLGQHHGPAAQRIAPQEIQLQEIAPQIVPDVLRSRHDHQGSPEDGQPAGNFSQGSLGIERECPHYHPGSSQS